MPFVAHGNAPDFAPKAFCCLKVGGKFAGYSFFSDGKCSTGYFTKFRLSGHGGWVHYQIITPAKDAENARRRAGDFLEKFGSAK